MDMIKVFPEGFYYSSHFFIIKGDSLEEGDYP